MTDTNITPNSDYGSVGPSRVAQVKADDPYYVVLPCDVKDFSKFVSGLLGKPQEVHGLVEGRFAIAHRDVENVYHVLQQRISKQNESSPIHFTISVYYNDGQSVTHNNLLDFNTYHPISKAVATGVIISATYLIKFVGKEAPEKQEIEVIFATHPEWHPTKARRWFNGGLYQFKIIHTERTWAEDIAGLLTKHGESLVQKPTKVREWFMNNMDELTTYLLVFIFMASLLWWSYSASGAIETLTNQKETTQITSALKGLVRGITIISVLGALLHLIGRFVSRNVFVHGVSSILFTDYDRENHNNFKKRTKAGWFGYFVAWTVSLMLGVASNVIYSKNWFW